MFGCIQLVLSSRELSNFVLFWNKELVVKYDKLQLCDEGTVLILFVNDSKIPKTHFT